MTNQESPSVSTMGTNAVTPTMMDGFEAYENVLEVSDLDTLMTEETTDADIHSISTTGQQAVQRSVPLSGRPPVQLYLSCDHDALSQYQVIVRQNIELFEARQEDVESNAQGRNNPIVLGQVGIRCRHCCFVSPSERTRGATYYPSKLTGLYQAAQNLAVSHLMGPDGCPHVPQNVRETLEKLREQKSAAGGGKQAWAQRTHALGVFEDEHGLRFADRLDAFANEVAHH
eukprot:CAMPEP_0172476534 /NCGR_PEP_ID=MMETSP1065-20121228/70427_1 /TAXON_ID=265537 /ORGANISM="Amphiprora paludosa, Strain CCMP125" /LENGTH=228 /DNA_ID=CAMNT_0013234757 /DNA_START=410 /DNA_END=1096 /DNA_ORIENTATION=+